MLIKDNLESINERIAKVADKSGRKAEDVKLVAITKTVDVEEMKELIDLGVKAIGESRVQIAVEKFDKLSEQGLLENVERHMIGHLQTNKVKLCVENFDVIESLDSLKLAKEIDKRALDAGKVMKVMIQVNVSGEEQKFGLDEGEALELYKKIMVFNNLKVIGVMCMAPWFDAEETRPYFKKAKEIAVKMNLKEISMGMTNDFEVAVEEGSTMVRVGRALFQ